MQSYFKPYDMSTSSVKYLGGLRTECTHSRSGKTFVTDAPVDNNGRGEAFSPTDLLATSYAACMMTIIGIYCEKHGHSFVHGEAQVTKLMASDPRRVSGIEIEMDLSGNDWDEKTQKSVVKAAEACPVAKSVHGDMEIKFTYRFN